ncbi:MAG TPA: hypothetical protein V6C85_27650 [Allocoleopsis sp.]
MKRLAIATVGLLLCVASGYSLNRVVLGMEATVLRELGNICSPQSVAEDFRLLGSRKWSHKAIVIYRVNCQTKNRFPPQIKNQLGYKILARKGIGWQVVGGGEHLEVLPQPLGELVQYGTSRNPNHQARQAIIYGEILSPTVAAVEVTFDNGKTLQDKGKGGIFVLTIPEAVGIREVRVLGTDGHVLQHDSKNLPTIYLDNSLSPVAPTLEDAIRNFGEDEQNSDCSNKPTSETKVLGDFRIVRTIEYSQGALVLTRLICRDATASILKADLLATIAYPEKTLWRKAKIMRSANQITYEYISSNERESLVWRLSGSISFPADYLRDYLSSPDSLASYNIEARRTVKGKNSARDYTYISGLALRREVVAVEATLSTGQTLRDRVTNGVFGIILPKASEIIELRLLGARGQVLRRDNVLESCPILRQKLQEDGTNEVIGCNY